nr:G protein-coupled receptor [Proales similis]
MDLHQLIRRLFRFNKRLCLLVVLCVTAFDRAFSADASNSLDNQSQLTFNRFNLNSPTSDSPKSRGVRRSDVTLCNGDICENGVFKWHKSKNKRLYLGGIFPMVNGWPGGQACLPSAIMALNQVNTNTSILPEYRLELEWFNSECDPGKGVSNLYEMIYHRGARRNDIITLLGPGCSDVSSSVAEVANYWNLTVVSFGSSSPVLSNRKRFKTFFRTHPSAILDNPARLSLCKKFNWKRIATLQSNKEVFTSTVDDLVKESSKYDIEIFARQAFADDPTDAVLNLKKQDARIIIGVFYEDEARKVFCRAFKERMLFPKYVWMIIGWYSDKWYLEGKEGEHGCNQTEMEIAAYGHLSVEVQFFTNEIYKQLDFGMSGVEFDVKFRNFVSSNLWKQFTSQFPLVDYKFHSEKDAEKSLLEIYRSIENSFSPYIDKLGGHSERSLAYDAVWVLAFALDKTLKKFRTLDDFKIENFNISQFIKESMRDTNFDGVSGRVSFDEKGDRISEVKIEQLQFENGILRYKMLGTHFKDKMDCCFGITWGNRTEPPVDGVRTINVVESISKLYSATFFVLTSLNMAIALACLALNIKFRNRTVIQNSLPCLNNLVILGSAMSLSSVYLFGLEKSQMRLGLFNLICQSEIVLLSIGFDVAYFSLFSKIWLVYTTSVVRKRSDGNKKVQFGGSVKLYSVLVSVLAFDLAFLSLWSMVDPLERRTIKLESEPDLNNEFIKQPIVEICKSNHELIWIGIQFCLKAIFLLLGLYLSFECRKVKMENINDLKYISFAIYNIVALVFIAGPVTVIVREQIDSMFFFIAITVNVSVLFTLLLIFLPKLRRLMRLSEAEEMQQMTLTQEMHDKLRENYFKNLRQNDELIELISKREQLLAKLDKCLSGGQVKKSETVRFNCDQIERLTLRPRRLSNESNSSYATRNNTSVFYFEANSEHKSDPRETLF